ncbi:hypothetical protein [Mumia sp. zg.B21]|uniref:hypothetical protein n=1 Tax=Mumia sp. zg.B21 TaxID=2855447 RepID=UPI0035AF6CBE
MACDRRRVAVRLRQARHALRRAASPSAGTRRDGHRDPGRDRRSGASRRRAHARAVLVAARRGGGYRGRARADARRRGSVSG